MSKLWSIPFIFTLVKFHLEKAEKCIYAWEVTDNHVPKTYLKQNLLGHFYQRIPNVNIAFIFIIPTYIFK